MPLRIEFLNIVISKSNSEQAVVVFDRIMVSSDLLSAACGCHKGCKEAILWSVVTNESSCKDGHLVSRWESAIPFACSRKHLKHKIPHVALEVVVKTRVREG